jgi:glycosyltransferase involved in cell wall biosynthesis
LGYVSNSQAAVDYLVAHRYDPSRFWVIRNGIDLSPFARISDKDRGKIRAKLEVTPDLPIIVCVGNLRSVKGHADLLRALSELAQSGMRFSAFLVGEGPLRQELEGLAGSLDIESEVRFVGEMDEEAVAEILHVTDVFVLASLREGTPTAVIEAMAAGCPVVATRVGGTPELVIDGVTGILVDPSNPKALASALRQLLTDQTLCRRMGAAGRERAAACFSIERMVHEYEDLYTSIAGPP